MTVTKNGYLYTAKCCKCGHEIHQVGEPFVDGVVIDHARTDYDHNGYMVGYACHSPFVSVMGRTFEEIREVSQRWRDIAAGIIT